MDTGLGGRDPQIMTASLPLRHMWFPGDSSEHGPIFLEFGGVILEESLKNGSFYKGFDHLPNSSLNICDLFNLCVCAHVCARVLACTYVLHLERILYWDEVGRKEGEALHFSLPFFWCESKREPSTAQAAKVGKFRSAQSALF